MNERGCDIDGCKNPAVRGGLCWGHLKRKQLKLPVDVELEPKRGLHAQLTPFDRLVEAALVLLEVRPTDKAGWRRAKHRLRMAAKRYTKASEARRSPHPRKA